MAEDFPLAAEHVFHQCLEQLDVVLGVRFDSILMFDMVLMGKDVQQHVHLLRRVRCAEKLAGKTIGLEDDHDESL